MLVFTDTLVRPALKVKFPTVKLDNDLSALLTEQSKARKTSPAFVGSSFELSADSLTAIITHIWTDQAGLNEFNAMHKALVEKTAALRAQYVASVGIVSTLTSRVEKMTLENAKTRISNARARARAVRKAKAAKKAAAKKVA